MNYMYRYKILVSCFVYLWFEKVYIFLIFFSFKVYFIYDFVIIELL